MLQRLFPRFRLLTALAGAVVTAASCIDEQEALKLYGANAAEIDTSAALADAEVAPEADGVDAAAASDAREGADTADGDGTKDAADGDTAAVAVDAAPAADDAEVDIVGYDTGDSVDVIDASGTTDVVEVAQAGDSADAAAVVDVADVALDVPSACTPGGCVDGNPCTDDECDPVVGCKNTPNTAGCDGGDGCTVGDVCAGGKCAVGKAKLFGKVYGGAAGVNGSAENYAYAITVLSDGGFAMAGSTKSTTLPGGQKSVGGEDFWFVRTDAAGQLLWNVTYGGSLNDRAQSVVATPDGGLAAAGYTLSTDLPGGQSTAGINDAYLVRTDATGKVLWSKAYGGSGAESAYGMIALPNGDFVLAGSASSTGLPGGQKSVGLADFWLVRVDSAGKLLWNQTYGGSGNEFALAVTGLPDGGFASAGVTNSVDLPGSPKNAGEGDLWLVRTDAVGKLLWNQTYGGSGGEAAYAVVALPDGGFAMAGLTNSTDLPGGQKSAGNLDVWLVRTDATGKMLWNRTYGGSTTDFASALVTLPDGGYAMVGQTMSTDLPGGQKSAGEVDFWLVRTDAVGNLLWNRTFGGESYDEGFAMTPLADGGFSMAGFTTSNSGDDAYLIRTDAFGHANCTDAGICAAKKASDCDDKKLCTADLCDGKLGCQHGNLADGSPCGDGKACKLGACQ